MKIKNKDERIRITDRIDKIKARIELGFGGKEDYEILGKLETILKADDGKYEKQIKKVVWYLQLLQMILKVVKHFKKG